MEKNNVMAIAITLLACSLAVNVVASLQLANRGGTPTDSFKWNGVICACKNSNGICYEGMAGANCNHNVITNVGKDAIEDRLLNNGTAFKYLAVGNGTVPAVADTTLNSEIATGGLTRALGTYYSNGYGNWSIVNTFTATATIMSVNSTAIFNLSSGGTMLAGGTFSNTNLGSADTLTINYTIALV
jgi:hypothetical protein